MGTKNIGLADLLFSKVQQRVLALFFANPDRSYYTNEIIRLSHSGTGAVLRELEKLASANLINVEKVGNQKLYRVNQSSPIFSELRSLVQKTFGIADVIREMLTSMFARIHVAFIYGSIAKGEDKASSDIDLMVIGDELDYPELYRLLADAEDKLGRHVNPTFYTHGEWIKKYKSGNNFINQVIRQPKIFIIGSENELI
ncbi:MAG TPA: nucleotidyltransferase domain-containing protein [Myxococcota bacterium]|nr:nucleotidyltransferase domain-containing protein [Myxococcota bacterium]